MRRLSINKRTRRNLVLALLVGGALLCSGCSFSREWKAALAQPIPEDGLSGPWEGQWVSSKNGHRGRLRCIMKPVDEGHFEARFHAVYWKILRASYRVPFDAEHSGERWKFEGKSDLGKGNSAMCPYRVL